MCTVGTLRYFLIRHLPILTNALKRIIEGNLTDGPAMIFA